MSLKITYTAPNRSHHYPYAKALHKMGFLHRFVCGFSRLSPRSPAPELGDRLVRRDLLQTVMLLSGYVGFSPSAVDYLRKLSDRSLDVASYKFAIDSDIFLFYRTEGIRTLNRLKEERTNVIGVMEEVNSHVKFGTAILQEEYTKLGLKAPFKREYDYDLRLKTYEQADYILCPSDFVKDSFLQHGFSENQLIKVNFGFQNLVGSPQSQAKENNTFRVLYVGQIHYRKGLRYALRAFKKLKHPHKEFIIVGPKTDITGLENEPIPDHVTFTGILKGDDLIREYSRASVFILPSLEEGLALVQGEALSFGVPLLITTNTGGADIITDGEEGFVVAPADSSALAERLQQMADDPLLLGEMSAKALQATERLGSWDIAAANLVANLKQIVENHSDCTLH